MAIKFQAYFSNVLGLFTQRFFITPYYPEIVVVSFEQASHQVVNGWAENAGFSWDFSPVRAFWEQV